MNKLSVTVGIPCYQAEKNIKDLLVTLVKQRTKLFKFDQILVYCDGCTDNTYERAKEIKSKLVEVINEKQNKGFVLAVNKLVGKSNSDVFILLNDDIKVKSLRLIEDLVRPFFGEKNLGLVGGKIVPYTPKTFIGKCVYVSTMAYDRAASGFKNGRSYLTVDGKILALKKDFYKNVDFSRGSKGNLDTFLYFENKKQGRGYFYTKDAQVWYRLPETIADFRNQELRNRRTRSIVLKEFNQLTKDEFSEAKWPYFLSVAKIFLRYPLESLIFKLIINRPFSESQSKSFFRWDRPSTTQNL